MGEGVRLDNLLAKHSVLETKIRDELRHPLPDTLRISNLKKRKLQLKEEIQQLSLRAG